MSGSEFLLFTWRIKRRNDMATIAESIENKLKDALRSRDAQAASVLRMAKTAIVNERISKMHDLSDEEEIAIVRREVKKREEASKIFADAGSQEAAETEAAEAKYLREFLPAEMSDNDLRSAIRKALSDKGINTPDQFGRAMGAAMKEVGGKVSGDRVSSMVKEELEKGQ